MITEWIKHPVSKGLLNIITEKLGANEEHLKESVVSGTSLAHLDLHILSQLRGQILVYREIAHIKDFLEELLTEDEVNNG
jgi:hypothetical protein